MSVIGAPGPVFGRVKVATVLLSGVGSVPVEIEPPGATKPAATPGAAGRTAAVVEPEADWPPVAAAASTLVNAPLAVLRASAVMTNVPPAGTAVARQKALPLVTAPHAPRLGVSEIGVDPAGSAIKVRMSTGAAPVLVTVNFTRTTPPTVRKIGE